MRVLILGGTRFIGPRLAASLLRSGAAVTVLHRGETGGPVPGTREVLGDRSTPGGLAGLGSERFDVVVDLSAYFADWTRAAVAGLTGRIGHYVFISSGAVYRPLPELPWPETTPFGPLPIWGRYGEEKVASERILWESWARGDFAVTTFRFPFILGPANFADRESFVLSRLEASRPILLPGGGDAINQFVALDDVVRGLVAAIEQRDRSAGEAFNCAFPRGLTNRGFVELCASLVGLEPDIVPIDAAALGVESKVVDLKDIVFPFPPANYLLDTSKLERRLGVAGTTSNRQMLEAYVEWWVAGGRSPLREYARETRALVQLGRSVL
jgi:nucleoside-diphosphate-sugar epimerase